jgi:8-oxo-dGTP diphosphatase
MSAGCEPAYPARMTAPPHASRGARAGAARRLALRTFRALPRPLRVLAVRWIAPGHTVGALCFLEREGRVLLLGQYHRNGWTLPGGLLNRGEDATIAVVREVREETGLRIQVGFPFATLVEPRSRRVDILFFVPVHADVAVQVAGEAVRGAWLTPAETGEVDEQTRASLAAFQRWRASGGAAHAGRVLPTIEGA